MTDCPEKMGLSEAGVSVDEKGVVVLPRVFGDGNCGGMGKLVGVADNEVVEGISGHFRKVVILSRRLFFILLIPDENQKVKVAGEQVGEIRNDDGGKALGYDAFLEFGRRADHKSALFQSDRLTVGKPGVDRGRCQLRGKKTQNLLPDIHQ